MPRQSDNPESNSTLPQAELNPLLNPVLGAHMGRWAEVYFTSPPEKREEAVLELLRELQGQTPTQNEPSAVRGEPVTDTVIEQIVERATLSQPPTLSEQGTTCPSCGHSTRGQRFCGMCGIEVQGTRSPTADPITDSEPHAEKNENLEESDERSENPSFAEFSHTDGTQFGMGSRSDEGARLIPDYQPVPYRYRIYLGAVIAILVSALVYMVWRGTQAGIGNPHRLPPPAPEATTESAARAQTPSLPNADAPDAAKTVNNHTSDAASGTSGFSGADPTVKNPEASPHPKVASVLASSPAEQALSSPQKGNGSEELAIAESYLNGSEGKTRDSAEAAKWLWRSVGKQNPTAALMLSDLYLRGNGVTKNCDQARLLLDAAAQKGISGAAERLRNLGAFGCQ